MALITRVAPHPDALVALLCDRLASPPEDPFVTEVVAVPTRGIERWITQRIALGLAERGIGDGICANVDFPSPTKLVLKVLGGVPDLAASVEAWETSGLVGHVLDAIDSHLDEPWMRLIQRYVETTAGEPGSNRLAAADKIAGLFTRYGRRRPAMIRAWAAGYDTGPGGAAIADGDLWQPRLWRAVREAIGVPSLAEVLPEGLAPIRRGDVALDLPNRVSVYGLTATDPLDLQVLAAIGEQRDLELFVLHPSPALWRDTASHLDATVPQRTARTDDPTTTLAHHPLLTSWGRDSRELQVVLASQGITAEPSDPAPAPGGMLLTRLQDDIRRNRPAAFDVGIADAVASGVDRSIQIHVGHGARRQAEVARDAILHVLAADPTLEPRDVVIMTPDLATFAPLLESAFPATDHGATGGLPDLRLRIADRSPAATNPLVRFAATVLGIAASRLEATLVRELVALPVVQQRFGFDTDTAGKIVTVIDEANISWGRDGADRHAWSAGSDEHRTWARGLDRALTGTFYSDSPVRVVAGIAPLDGVEGQEANPVGYLAAIIDRIGAIADLTAAAMPRSQWAGAISSAVRMLAAPAWGDEWQLSHLDGQLAETFPAPEPTATDPLVSLAEARRAISSWTRDRPSRLHFRTGDVTVCTLVPMRSVPYRVVCLLGMDDDRFPRSSRADGDDLLLDDEVVGDEDRSARDRQLLLDAVMAAGDHLIVTYSGRDEITNAELPPAVPVAELCDVLDDMLGPAAADRLVLRHPLQSFSEANFRAGDLGIPGPFGFDDRQLAGARAVQARPTAVPPADIPWPPFKPPDMVRLTDLIDFLKHPAKHFMKVRMGFAYTSAGDIPDDTIPADLGPLDLWGVKNRIVTGLGAGNDVAALTGRERASDALPPGELGGDDLEKAADAAGVLWEAAIANGYDPQRMRPWSGEVTAGGFVVEGTVLADEERAHLASVTPSTLKGKQRLQAYAELVFLTLLRPEVAWHVLLLGKGSGDKHLAVTIRSLGSTESERRTQAEKGLATLVQLYREGLQEPMPLPCESAFQWQCNVGPGEGVAKAKTRTAFEDRGFPPDRDDEAHKLLFPELGTTEDLLVSDFKQLCMRLWGPIIPLLEERPI